MRRRLTSRLRKPTLKKKKTETRPKKRMTRALSPPLARRRAEYLTPTEAADRLLVATVTLRRATSAESRPASGGAGPDYRR
jgi:hypothetical protein